VREHKDDQIESADLDKTFKSMSGQETPQIDLCDDLKPQRQFYIARPREKA